MNTIHVANRAVTFGKRCSASISLYTFFLDFLHFFFQTKMHKIYLIFLTILVTTQAQRTFLDNFAYKGRAFKTFTDRLAEQQLNTNQWNVAIKRKSQIIFNESSPFPCQSPESFRSSTKPNSVHRLKPGDIDVVGAIGDSLTAGFGALSTNFVNLFRDYRGVSFPIGGEKTWQQYLTIPNILKVFNPNLVGYPSRSSNTFERASQFNVAEDGGSTSDMPLMTKNLIKRILSDKRVNVQEDWKMITIFMGSNDFCQACYEKDPLDLLKIHERNLLGVLRMLRDNLPRTFVNLVNPPYVNLIAEIKNPPPMCFFLQRFSCPCLVGEPFKHLHSRVVDLIGKWQKLEEDIATYDEFDKDDFTVVNQPVFQEAQMPRTADGEVDLEYLAEDCFHFSQKAHSLVANALWNIMLQPVGRKQKSVLVSEFRCPTSQSPYIFTRRNSDIVMIK